MDQQDSSSGLMLGMIIGGVVAVVILFGVIVAGFLMFWGSGPVMPPPEAVEVATPRAENDVPMIQAAPQPAPAQELEIAFDAVRLKNFGLDPKDAIASLRAAGYVVTEIPAQAGSRSIRARIVRGQDPDRLRDLTISSANGQKILLRDVAVVEEIQIPGAPPPEVGSAGKPPEK